MFKKSKKNSSQNNTNGYSPKKNKNIIPKFFNDLFSGKKSKKQNAKNNDNISERSVSTINAVSTTSTNLYSQQQYRKGSDAFSESTLFSNTGNGNTLYGKNEKINGKEEFYRVQTIDSTDSNYSICTKVTSPSSLINNCHSNNISIIRNNNKFNNNNNSSYNNNNSCLYGDYSISNNLSYTNNSSRTSFISSPCSSLTSFNNYISFNRIPLNLEGRHSTTMPILTLSMAEQIRNKIPSLYKEAIHWKLLYSIDQHGLSLKTLYSNVRNAGPCVMVILTEEDDVFGAFTSEPFDPTISNRFYGSGLSFLWKLCNNSIKFYEALNTNQYYMLADNKFIAMGGGDGKFGFYLNHNLINGYISPCMTYTYNDTIIDNENFECYGLEIWGFEF